MILCRSAALCEPQLLGRLLQSFADIKARTPDRALSIYLESHYSSLPPLIVVELSEVGVPDSGFP